MNVSRQGGRGGDLAKLIGTIAQDVVETSAVTGLMVKQNTTRGDPRYHHAPLALFPTPYPLDMYKEALSYQHALGELICGIIERPRSNIHALLTDFAKNDEFMSRLLEVSKAFTEQKARGEPVQDIHCLVLRSDYMIDEPTRSLKLVEYNTVASSFCCLANQVNEMHRYIMQKYGGRVPFNYGLTGGRNFDHKMLLGESELEGLPDCRRQMDKLVAGLAQGIQHYQQSTGEDPNQEQQQQPVIMLFVCEDDERNLCDQKLVELKLQREFGILSLRRTLAEVAEQAEFDQRSKKLSIEGMEVGLVYFRTGYQADHYMVTGTQEWDELKWQTRQMLECSLAIKCPSIDLHLATFKKYQQSFADEALLREVSGSHQTTNIVKRLFKGIWSLENLCQDGAEVNDVVERALTNPHEYVLKPQKEGGGNNFFDDELLEKLQQAKAANGHDPALSTYLIMERINPPMIPAALLRNGEVEHISTMSEFGFYSMVYTRNTGQEEAQHETLQNEVFGHLMRTKASHFNEGGVNAGYAVIDQPLIVSHEEFYVEGGVKGSAQV